jgi:hypothetical protein
MAQEIESQAKTWGKAEAKAIVDVKGDILTPLRKVATDYITVAESLEAKAFGDVKEAYEISARYYRDCAARVQALIDQK